jgi:predicted AAA+ superfamily ATPase
MFYFRDSAGNEVDLILEKQEGVMAVEIKSAKRFNTGMLTGIRYWQKYNRNDRGILIMSSDKSHSEIDDDRIGVLGWQEVIKV